MFRFLHAHPASGPAVPRARAGHRKAIICWLIAVASGGGLDLTVVAQDDPFLVPAVTPNLSASSNSGSDEADEAGPPDTPLSEQLKLRARRGGAVAADSVAADSVAALARIGRWKDVDVILTELAGRQINNETLVAMGARIEPAVMIRIRSSDQVSDNAKDMIRRISVAAKSANESPDRMRRAIADLGATSRDRQVAGLRELRRGGRAAVVELISALVADKPVATRDKLVRALVSFGPGGLESLRQIALYGRPKPRGRALAALATAETIGAATPLLIVEWVTALHAIDSTDQERNLAIRQLAALGMLSETGPTVTREVALETLRDDLQRKRSVAKDSASDDIVVTMWSLDDGLDGVVYQEVPAGLKAYRDASDASARLRRVGTASSVGMHQALSSDLGYRLMVDADWGEPNQVQSLRDAYPSLTTPEGLSAAIDFGTSNGDAAAAVGVLRLVSVLASPVAEQMRHGATSQASPLVRAVDHANARVRFEAAAVIASIERESQYAGSSRVRKTLNEMRSLGVLPTAVLLETLPDVVVRQEGLLSRMGLQVSVVGSAADLLRRVDAGGDIRLILAKTEIADTTPVELVDRVRRVSRGRELPILFYGYPSPGLDTERWAASDYPASVALIDHPVSTEGLRQAYEAARGFRQLPPLSTIDRHRFRRIGTEALAHQTSLQ